MTEFRGAGQVLIKCDYCGASRDVTEERSYDHGAPDGWWFVAMGNTKYLEGADDVWHFCSKEHLISCLHGSKIDESRLNELA